MAKPMLNIFVEAGRTDVFCLVLLALPANSLLPAFCYIPIHPSHFLSWCEVYICPWTKHTILCNHCMMSSRISWNPTSWSSWGLSCSCDVVYVIDQLLSKIWVKVLLDLSCLCALLVNQPGIYHCHSKYRQVHSLRPIMCLQLRFQLQGCLTVTVVLIDLPANIIVDLCSLWLWYCELHILWLCVFLFVHLPPSLPGIGRSFL